MKRSVSAEVIENAVSEMQEAPKKARSDPDDPETMLAFMHKESIELIIASNNVDPNNLEDFSTNGHHEIVSGSDVNMEHNGFSEHAPHINGAQAEDHINGAFDLEPVQAVPDNFMEETTPENEETLPTKFEEEPALVEEISKATIKHALEQEPAPADIEEMGAGSSRSEGWDQRELSCWALEGHADKVNALALDGNILVTASDDTSLRVWDLASRREVCSLRGHKAAVTSVCLLPVSASYDLLVAAGEKVSAEASGQRVVLSGSTDCCAKLWLIPEGRMLRSIYTFNTILHVGYITENSALLTATDAGKLELFNAVTSDTLSSVKAFNLPVAALKVSGGMIVCGDTHGKLQVWGVRENRLRCLRSTNAVETSNNSLSALDLLPNGAITGHLSGSLKSTSWTTGVVKRLRSACKGRVDGLCVSDELLVATSSDKDSSALHLYKAGGGEYLGSVQNEGRMLGVAASRAGQGWRLVTGGNKLRVWETDELAMRTEENERDVVDGQQQARITLWPEPEYVETDSEDEGDEAGGDDEPPAKKKAWGGCQVQ